MATTKALSSSLLCRCICGSSQPEILDPNRAFDTFADANEDEPPAPTMRMSGYVSYCATTDQPLRGVPIREGNLWLLSVEEEVALVMLSLYVNGFSFTHRGREHCFSLSPFSLVRNCKFQATTKEGTDLSSFKCFKVALFTQGVSFFFGIRNKTDGTNSEEERSRWVIDMSRAMRLVTQSLFPHFSIATEPIPDVKSTHFRVMAGYLVHHDDVAIASVLYCELHPQRGEHGKMVIYENEVCQVLVMEICITERSTCCEKLGISCSCFSVENHVFSTRTLAERKLWLRAISNVKVKLQNHAPDPSREDLHSYRQAIREHINLSKTSFTVHSSMDPLLHRHPVMSDKGLRETDSGFQDLLFPPAAAILKTPNFRDCQDPTAASVANEADVFGSQAASSASMDTGAFQVNEKVESERTELSGT